MSDFTFGKVKMVVDKARAGSAPESSRTFKIYKNCLWLLARLAKLLKTLWKKKELQLWTLAEGCFVPKELNSSCLDQFREISLLDVEGKIFCSVIAKRLSTSLLANEYVDTSVQKGGVPGFLGCLEHTSVMSQVIKEAKTNNSTLSVVWLNLAKAFKISGTLLCTIRGSRTCDRAFKLPEDEVLNRGFHHQVAETSEGYHGRLHNICGSIFSCNYPPRSQ